MSQSVRPASVFDKGASRFAAGIDADLRSNCYWRGELFVTFAKRNIQGGNLILDFGCGPGRISAMLAQAGFQVLGVDPSAVMIGKAKEQNADNVNPKFEVGGEEVINREMYDGVVCSSVIEYSDDPDRLLQLFNQSLPKGATLIISYSNRLGVNRWYHRLVGHKNQFETPHHKLWTWAGFKRLLERNGFICREQPTFVEFHWRLDSFLSRIPIGDLGIVVAYKDSEVSNIYHHRPS
jgi:SAM-dependent methyltransferase